jgi:hypothetical protein
VLIGTFISSSGFCTHVCPGMMNGVSIYGDLSARGSWRGQFVTWPLQIGSCHSCHKCGIMVVSIFLTMTTTWLIVNCQRNRWRNLETPQETFYADDSLRNQWRVRNTTIRYWVSPIASAKYELCIGLFRCRVANEHFIKITEFISSQCILYILYYLAFLRLPKGRPS